MRCNWQRWLWGLIPLLMVSWAAIYVERERIQEDLVERANAALAGEGSRWANVEASGRDITLTGRAAQEGEPPRAEEALRKVWGVREVENRSILPPKVEPFIWAARRRGNRIRLTGYVPDRATQRAVLGLTKAAVPGLEVVDRMNTARGVPAPDTWLAGLSFALKQLSLLKNGDARFEDLALTISGEAEDVAAFKAVNMAMKSGLPKGIKLASVQIVAPAVTPYTWSAQFAGGQLVLAGNVAGGEKGRQDFLAAAKAAAPGLSVVDRMEFGEGAPQGWANVAIALINEVVKLDSGAIEMKDTALTVGGIAQDEAHAQAVRSALRSAIPPAYTLIDQVRVREVKAPPPPPPQVKSGEAGLPPPAEPKSETARDQQPPPSLDHQPGPLASASEPRPERRSPGSSAVEGPAAPPQPGPPAKGSDATGPSPPEAKLDIAPPAASSRRDAGNPVEEKRNGDLPSQATAQAVPTPAKDLLASAESAPNPALAPKQSGDPAEKKSDVDVPARSAAETPPAPDKGPPASPEPAPKIASAPAEPAPLSREANKCQAELNRLVSAGHILFATDSAKLDSSSFTTLDKLAAAARACPEVRIAIEGHTDAEGSSEYNQRLSVRRARAVVSYLVKAGADRQQLEAVGYGLTRPAAPNDSEENMARNRRIEFSVRHR